MPSTSYLFNGTKMANFRYGGGLHFHGCADSVQGEFATARAIFLETGLVGDDEC